MQPVRSFSAFAATTLLVFSLNPVAAAGVPECFGKEPTIIGTAGDDFLEGTRGPDVIQGLDGDDTIFGYGGADLLCGDDGDDEVSGVGRRDKLSGGLGHDALYPGAGADELRGGAGKDVLVASPGRDSFDGGPGKDTVTWLGSPGPVRLDLERGFAASKGVRERLGGIERAHGSTKDDVLLGSDVKNAFEGDDGSDRIVGRGGDDFAHGGPGRDTCKGIEDELSCER